MKTESLLKNEDGTVLIVTLIILVFLTIIGISASTTSTIEIQIAGNERIYKQNFYRAEAAAMHAIQKLEDTDLVKTPPTWLIPNASESQILTDDFWTTTGNAPSDTFSDSDSHYFGVEKGLAKGASLDMAKTKVYEYDVYGRSTETGGRVIIGIGYRKAF